MDYHIQRLEKALPLAPPAAAASASVPAFTPGAPSCRIAGDDTSSPPPPVAVQWLTVQGAGAAAKAAGAAGHEEGARALPALRGAAGPLALAPPPPPDAPAFDAVAYGMAPPLPPGRGAAATTARM